MSGFSRTGLDSRDKISRMSPTLNRDAVLGALKVVIDPDLRRDIVSLGFVKDVAIDRRQRLVHDRADDAGVSGEGPDARSGCGGGARAAGRHQR